MLGGLVYSQYLPGNSWLHRLDPRAKLLLLVLATFALFWARKLPVFLSIAALLGLLPVLSGLPRRMAMSVLAPLLPVVWLTLLFQGRWGPPPWESGWSLTGLEAAGFISLRLLVLALCAQVLALTTSPIALCDALEFALRPLGRLGLPHRDLALAFTIAWRFIPVLAQENERLLKAQLARGAAWDEGPWRRRLVTLTGLLTPLLVRCFRYAEELALALEARGYGQPIEPTRLHPLCWRGRDTLALLGGMALCVVTVVGEIRL